MSFGGPALGFLATRDRHVRQMPGRLCGETVDSRQAGFVLTLSTREQHIRREKRRRTSARIRASAADRDGVPSLLGRVGLAKLARLNFAKAEYMKQQVARRPVSGCRSRADLQRVRRVGARCAAALARALDAGIVGGLDLAPYAPELGSSLLVCATELSTRDAIDRLIAALAGRTS